MPMLNPRINDLNIFFILRLVGGGRHVKINGNMIKLSFTSRSK
jgi:hypothetical protein